MKKYSKELSQINNYISEFNSFLKPEFAFSLFNLELIETQDLFLCIVDKTWDEIQFPKNRDSAGIYLYFATSEIDPNDRRLYIGKASFKRNIGLRLYDHFRIRFKDSNFTEIFNNIPYRIEMITSIAVPNQAMTFFASAFEEFLIARLQNDSIRLLNKTGNYSS